MNNSRKVALVTGASRGIGAAIVRRLTQDGFAVAINYVSSQKQAQALADELGKNGAVTCLVQGDVASDADVKRMFARAEQELGRVSVLVNNAGILKTTPVAQTSDELFEQTFGVNVRGVFNTLRLAATQLAEGGRIINLSSTALALNMPGYAVYNASKAAVESLTRVFAKELRGRSITVNAVAPGPVETELFLEGKTAEQVQAFAKMPPLEHLGQPEDIANVVAFLAGSDSAWVNGQVLRANGGIA